MDKLTGKVAVVTGGASGIGHALAQLFIDQAMSVAVLDIEGDALQAAKASLQQRDEQILFLQVDVTDRNALTEAAEHVERSFGRIDLACNNAGVATPGPADNLTFDDWDWVLGVNLGGVLNGTKIFSECIKKHGEGGHIVNTASMAGLVGGPGGVLKALLPNDPQPKLTSFFM